MEISTACKEKPHLVGSPGTTERRIWMQKLLESMTKVFPAKLTADYTRAGWCYLKVTIKNNCNCISIYNYNDGFCVDKIKLTFL